jgi:hypothetical protein
MPVYNHAFTIAFSIESNHPTGEDITTEQAAEAIKRWLATAVEENTLLENMYLPYDTHEVPE